MATTAANSGLIAVDVGNSRIKFGRFEGLAGSPLPEPMDVFDLPITDRDGSFDATRMYAWCSEHVANGATWYVASVYRAAANRLVDEVKGLAVRPRCNYSIRKITFQDVPLAVRVEEPARVGIDRLLAAFAADRLRRRDRAAIIVDLGTAITVDLLEADGAFAGGAILPGIGISARALAEQTDALPHIGVELLEHPPAVLGKSTTTAIEAGLFWGAVGAIREIISQLAAGLDAPPDVFLTGGASPHVAGLLAREVDSPVRHVPHLVLSGIALVKT